MSFSLGKKEDYSDGVRRLAFSQLKSAVETAGDAGTPLDERVHDFRKRCKKLRALLRLLRPVFREHARELNGELRDIARTLAPYRDTAAIIAAFDALVDRFSDESANEDFSILRRSLSGARSNPTHVSVALKQATERLERVTERIEAWDIDEITGRAVLRGFRKTYRRARRAMRVALEKPSAESFHEWRKQLKYHAYQCRVLRKKFASLLADRVGELETLAGWLGEEHDLAIVEERLGRGTNARREPRKRDTIHHFIRLRRNHLQDSALKEGAGLFALKPSEIEAALRGRTRRGAHTRAAIGRHSAEARDPGSLS